MTEPAETTPLSDAEREQLAALQFRQSMEAWQADEERREADLALIEPVITALGDAEALSEQIADLREAAAGLDRESQLSVERIISILDYDGRALAGRHARLSQPAPQPLLVPVESSEPGE